MRTSAKALWIGCAIFTPLIGAAVDAQEACATYTVAEGDHLRNIARKAYGDPDLYRLIFDANRDTIGQKADLILTGATLVIPCKPGTAEATTAEPAAEVAATEVVDQPSVPLTTEVIDPAKEPVVILPEIPVEGAEAETVEVVVEEVAPAAEEPAPEVAAADEPAIAPATEPTEEAPAVEAAAVEPTEVAKEEPVTAVAEALIVEEEAAVDPAAVAEAAPVEPAPTETAAADPEPAGAEPTGQPAAGPIRIVTGNDYSPFADEMLAGGGMFTQIVEMAIFRADPDLPYSLTFINDWQAHIDALLPMQSYDLSFPWIRPACETPETLSAGDLARCNDFVFSAPYYEVVDGFFAAADSELLVSTEYSDFVGKRICRPEAYTTGVLEAQGLGPDKVTMSRPLEASDCFEALAAGAVDIVSIDTAVGDAILTKMGLTETFRQNPSLTNLLTLHVIAHKSNPRAVEMLKVLDEGAMKMNQSGEWWDIVSDALDKQ